MFRKYNQKQQFLLPLNLNILFLKIILPEY